MFRCGKTLKGYEQIWVPIAFVLLIPLITGLFVGAEFSANSISQVPTAVVDMDNSQMSRDLSEKFRTNNVLDVTEYPKSISELERLIEMGDVTAGVIIPSEFAKDLSNGEAPKIMVLYDGAQMSMTGAAKGKIGETVATIKSGYMMKVMMGKLGISQEEAAKYIQPIQCTTRSLGNPARSTAVFMLQGLLLNFTQVAVYILGIELVRKKHYNMKSLCKDGMFAGGIGSLSVLLMISSQVLFFDAPFRGSIPAAAVMSFLYLTGIGTLGVATMVKCQDRLKAVKTAMMVMMMFVLCGYTFPTLGMPPAMQLVAKFLPFTYYAGPMRDISLLGCNFEMMLPNIVCICIFLAVSVLVLKRTLKKRQDLETVKFEKLRGEHTIVGEGEVI